ncbi:hypothetical protein GCM10023321_81080 [Pseudonocardia eucalypti]|uniref:Uncharacterized protein n=1 Tax=Pseudonocardia eucalypti TaxID=648755 RepID=A0ABP9RE49_9PSEU
MFGSRLASRAEFASASARQPGTSGRAAATDGPNRSAITERLSPARVHQVAPVPLGSFHQPLGSAASSEAGNGLSRFRYRNPGEVAPEPSSTWLTVTPGSSQIHRPAQVAGGAG